MATLNSKLPANTGTPTGVTDNCTATADISVTYVDNNTGLTGCNGTEG